MRGRLVVLAHGGNEAKQEHQDGPEAASRAGLEALRRGATPLDAAVAAVRLLEDDGRFNAGSGSIARVDGVTLEMDAACTDGSGRFGAVAGLRSVHNPILVARAVIDTPHNLLAGAGAELFARQTGLAAPHRPSAASRAACETLRAEFAAGRPNPAGWTPTGLSRLWNYRGPPACDTVGAVATDGSTFAAAASTGGLVVALHGRVSDVAMVGCGLHAGPAGAVAVTGQGEYLARILAAWRAHDALGRGATPAEAAQGLMDAMPEGVSAGAIVLGQDGHAAATNRTMPWAVALA